MSLWFEITATVPPDDVDVVAAIMRDASPGGVTIEEPVDILGPEMGFRVRGREPVLVRAYLPSSELGAVLTEDLRQAMTAFPAVELTARPIYEQDWSVSWREFFGVVDTGRIVIVPTWVEHEVAPGQISLLLDPGQAFGTGHHETTRLCLMALDELVRPGDGPRRWHGLRGSRHLRCEAWGGARRSNRHRRDRRRGRPAELRGQRRR
jgi:ribosomal protein L11 methyltransferase